MRGRFFYLLVFFVLAAVSSVFAAESISNNPSSSDQLVFAGFDGSTWVLWRWQDNELIRLVGQQDATSSSVARDGRIAFADAAGAIRIIDREGKLSEVANIPTPCNHPTWSPDGKRLAFACFRFSNRQDDGALWVADFESGGVSQLYDGPGLQKSPAWSPDGHRLAFVSGYRLTPSRVVETIWVRLFFVHAEST